MVKSKSKTKPHPHHELFEYLKELGNGQYVCTDSNLDLDIKINDDYHRLSIKSRDPNKPSEERIKYSTCGGSLRYDLVVFEKVELNSSISPRTSFKVDGGELNASIEDKPPYRNITSLLLNDILVALKARELEKVSIEDKL